MLSRTENEFLTRVGPGTPMGDLFRRFWLPAMLSTEVEAPDSPPVRLRLLGEDLVGFRDTNNRVGIMEPYCAHKQVHLFWGRNEQCGLRCTYHGWKYDVDGNCTDMPNEPAESNFMRKISLQAYPTREAGGVVWVYMGPTDKQPSRLPQLEWTLVPAENRVVSKWLQRTNWCQGMEGEIDTSHTTFLHGGHGPLWDPAYPGATGRSANTDQARIKAQRDGAPRLTVRQTDYGFTYGSRRQAGEDEYYWRVTRWMYPFYSLIPGSSGNAPGGKGTGGRCWVPIDDEHTWTFGYACMSERPYTQEERDRIMSGINFPPRLERGTYQLKDGYIIDTWLPLANRDNDYLIDRELQSFGNFTGIYGTNDQDRSIQESMGGRGSIVDRSREHLGTTDIAGIAARRLLITAARNLQAGIEPSAAHDADAYHLRGIDVVTATDNFDQVLATYERELGVALA